MQTRQDLIENTVAVIMAGGMGSRLFPLTRDRAKPAVPFGGHHRIIDFVLTNCVNSGIKKTYVVPQYKFNSLEYHMETVWKRYNRREPLDPRLDEIMRLLPPQMQEGQRWYGGTADCVFQNMDKFLRHKPEHLLILGGDHIYKMNYAYFIADHEEQKADASVGVIEVPIEEAHKFGVLEVDDRGWVIGFKEKPKEDPIPIPGKPDKVYASMGIYVFNKKLMEQLWQDRGDRTDLDFGNHVIPGLLKKGGSVISAFNFNEKNQLRPDMEIERGNLHYWEDLGTIDSYLRANLDLKNPHPQFDMYSPYWPAKGLMPFLPPSKFVHDSDGRRGTAPFSLISPGTIISGSEVRDSVVGHNVRVHSYSSLSEVMLLGHNDVGERCDLRHVIIDKGVVVPPGTRLGHDWQSDIERLGLEPVYDGDTYLSQFGLKKGVDGMYMNKETDVVMVGGTVVVPKPKVNGAVMQPLVHALK